MVEEVYERSRLEELIRASRLLLVLVYDSRSPYGRYLSGLVDDMARSLEPVIGVVRVDAAEAPDAARVVGRPPRLALYIEGERVWEQIGFFYSPQSDRYAIRRGLLNALRSRGLSPARLRIRLDF